MVEEEERKTEVCAVLSLLYDTYTISHLCFYNVPFVLLHTCANKLMEWLHDSRSIGLAIWRLLFSVRLTATI